MNKYKSIRFDCVYVNTNFTKFSGFSEESVEVAEILNLLLKVDMIAIINLT